MSLRIRSDVVEPDTTATAPKPSVEFAGPCIEESVDMERNLSRMDGGMEEEVREREEMIGRA